MTIKTYPWDGSKYLGRADAQTDLLNEALELGDPKFIVHVIGLIAKARGMSELAKAAGISRSTLYKALADDANPTLETVMKVLDALKLELRAEPKAEDARHADAA